MDLVLAPLAVWTGFWFFLSLSKLCDLISCKGCSSVSLPECVTKWLRWIPLFSANLDPPCLWWAEGVLCRDIILRRWVDLFIGELPSSPFCCIMIKFVVFISGKFKNYCCTFLVAEAACTVDFLIEMSIDCFSVDRPSWFSIWLPPILRFAVESKSLTTEASASEG